jgi:hypothetical protein
MTSWAAQMHGMWGLDPQKPWRSYTQPQSTATTSPTSLGSQNLTLGSGL